MLQDRMMPEGRFVIPTRIFLTSEQRAQLEGIVRRQGIELEELMTELVIRHLEQQPEPEAPLTSESAEHMHVELQRRRAELRRLRGQQVIAGSSAPDWLAPYIADLEREIIRLEQDIRG